MRYCSRLYNDKSISGLVYTLGLVIVVNYAFSTHYYSVGDAERTFYLVQRIADEGFVDTYLALKSGLYQLQITGVGSLLPPVWIHKLTGLSVPVSIKLYHSVAMPVVPVLVYWIARVGLCKALAIGATLTVIGQVCFLQAPSYERFMIAMVPYCVIVLAVFRCRQLSWRYLSIVVVAAIAMVLTHYGASMVTILILTASMAVCLLLRWRYRQIAYGQIVLIGVSLFAVVVSTGVWHFGINSAVIQVYSGVSRAVQSKEALLIAPPDSEGFDIGLPDKIIQVAFGSRTPDGDTSVKVNPLLFWVSWLMVGLTCLGVLRALIVRDMSLHTAISLVMMVMLLMTVAIPYLSRIYGIERTYFQAGSVLSISLVLGLQYLSNVVRVRSEFMVLPLATAYGVLSYSYGRIVSIMG